MAHEAGKGSGRRKEDVSKVRDNWDLIFGAKKKAPVTEYLLKEVKPMEFDHKDEDDDGSDWVCEVCGGPMYTQPHWSYGQCDDCGARQEMESDDY